MSEIGRRQFILTGVTAAVGFMACRPGRIFSFADRLDLSLAERLGHPADARLIILHADDIGCTHSANAAVRAAYERGAINSGSVMVTCPAFPEFAEWARNRPGLDLGVHLTFTSERPSLRWGPVLPAAKVPSLVDPDGLLPLEWSPKRRVWASEVEAEIRAQIERARSAGIEPTHLDSHQHFLQLDGPEVFGALVRVARDYHLPFRVSRNWFSHRPYLQTAPDLNIPLDNRIEMRIGFAEPAGWTAWYVDRIRQMPPGVTELLVHPGYDDAELRAFASDSPDWGAAWRQRDLDAVTSPEVQRALRAVGAIRITWGDLGRVMRG